MFVNSKGVSGLPGYAAAFQSRAKLKRGAFLLFLVPLHLAVDDFEHSQGRKEDLASRPKAARFGTREQAAADGILLASPVLELRNPLQMIADLDLQAS